MKSLEERKQEFIQKAKNKFGDKFDYSKVEYVNVDTKVLIKCPIHGFFWQSPYKHLQSHTGCPKCSNLIPHRKRLTKDELLKRFNKIHDNKYSYVINDYKSRKDSITIICPKHGEFTQTVNDHLSGCGCRWCYEEKFINYDSFLERAINIHDNKYDYSEVDFISANKPVKIICKTHGEFYQTPQSHLRGSGCPKCILKSQSRLYDKLLNIYPTLIFEYSTEWLFPQRFDMYLKEYNIAIEYNGEQHYHPVKRFGGEEGYKICQERDKRKMEKCLQNNCKLFIVRYDHEEEDTQYIITEINKLIKNYENCK